MQTELFKDGLPVHVSEVKRKPVFRINIHERENNSESENHLNENRKKFSKQCLQLLKLLLDGEKIKTYDALVVFNITSISRRACDLIENGIPIEREFMNGENVKTYFIKDENIPAIREKYFPSLNC